MAPRRSVFSNYAFYYYCIIPSKSGEETKNVELNVNSYCVLHSRLSDNGISVFGGGSSSSMGRPTFAGRIQNVTVNVGKEAVLACPVNDIGKYKVRQH